MTCTNKELRVMGLLCPVMKGQPLAELETAQRHEVCQSPAISEQHNLMRHFPPNHSAMF